MMANRNQLQLQLQSNHLVQVVKMPRADRGFIGTKL